MKKTLIPCLMAVILAAALPAVAAEPGSAIVQQAAAATSARDDVVAMRKEMERLSEETAKLADAMKGSEHEGAILSVQEHAKSLTRQAEALEKKMDAEAANVMAQSKK